MLRFTRSALWLVAAAAMLAGQPALTTIQDILYRADGTRFNGTMFINWSSFQAGDTSNIATASLALPIVNGVLNVKLVPTTTASAGAQYNITYNSRGVNQFTQVWAVPPSSVTLRVRDVLVSQGTVVGPPPLSSTVQISDVAGLQNQLAIRPQEGFAFALGRAAVINSSGQIDGASGNLSDCVHVDGSSGPCGSAGGGSGPTSFSDGETPAGSVNGSNTGFTLGFAPSPAASLDLFENGLLMKQGVDYVLSSNTITFLSASTPQPGDILLASYRFANSAGSLSSASPQVICSSAGTSTSAASATQLGSCTIPGGTLTAGDRIEIEFQFAHTGTSSGFTGAVLWGGTTAITRSPAAADSGLAGRVSVGIGAAGQYFNAQDWGASLGIGTVLGTLSADLTQNLTIQLQAQLATAAGDTVQLGNFTVVRYPAQSNP
jgi:hypothetical protein